MICVRKRVLITDPSSLEETVFFSSGSPSYKFFLTTSISDLSAFSSWEGFFVMKRIEISPLKSLLFQELSGKQLLEDLIPSSLPSYSSPFRLLRHTPPLLSILKA
jgi:hypothetical protein